MIRGKELEEQVFENYHIENVLNEMALVFDSYFSSFKHKAMKTIFREHIEDHQNEITAYKKYLDPQVLEEYEYDPNAFKVFSKNDCPIIHRCLWSRNEFAKTYNKSFNRVSGRELLNTVKMISNFGMEYVESFNDNAHENVSSPSELNLETLSEEAYYLPGVIGYGIQSTLLYGVYPQQFAHRSQNAVWMLYFLSGRKDFGLLDGSEFLIIHVDKGTIEQNYYYPPPLFGFYAIKIYLMLQKACELEKIPLFDQYRYIYLSAFSNHVASLHFDDINTYRRSSEDVESQPWF